MSNDNGKSVGPVEDTGPEWDTVEQERDYWKKLALSYGAKLGALKATMDKEWTVEIDAKGDAWITEDAKAVRVDQSQKR